MIDIRPAETKDLPAIGSILSDWLSKDEVDHYTKSVKDIVSGSSSKPQFDSHYFVAVLNQEIIGVAGFRTPLPKLLNFTSTSKPAELCMLYVAKDHKGKKGAGKALLDFVISQAIEKGYEELVVRSAEKFKDTGWGFYDHMGFTRVGELLPPDSKTMSQVRTKKL